MVEMHSLATFKDLVILKIFLYFNRLALMISWSGQITCTFYTLVFLSKSHIFMLHLYHQSGQICFSVFSFRITYFGIISYKTHFVLRQSTSTYKVPMGTCLCNDGSYIWNGRLLHQSLCHLF